jgi:hypothetical protein
VLALSGACWVADSFDMMRQWNLVLLATGAASAAQDERMNVLLILVSGSW